VDAHTGPVQLRLPQALADAAAVHGASTRVQPLLADVAAAPLDDGAVGKLAKWMREEYPRGARALRRLRGAGPDADGSDSPDAVGPVTGTDDEGRQSSWGAA
jgi:hypothetical protein